MTSRGRCHFCGNEVTDLHEAARKASGWYVERSRGLHGLIDRRDEPNVIAHASCLRVKGQTSMLGDAA